MRTPRSVLLMLVPAALGLVGCSSAPPFDSKAMQLEWRAFMDRDYSLRPGDKLAVQFGLIGGDASKPDEIEEVVVSPTGTIDLRMLDAPLQVSGRTIGAVRTVITEAYKARFQGRVGVSLVEAAVQSVYVCGEVFRSGPVPYTSGLTMTQAIATAGSFHYTIKDNDVRVLRIAGDGSQRTIRVNLSAILHAEEPDLLLLPGDVVYCQTSAIADLGNLVDLYIRRLLPFSLSGPALGRIGN